MHRYIGNTRSNNWIFLINQTYNLFNEQSIRAISWRWTLPGHPLLLPRMTKKLSDKRNDRHGNTMICLGIRKQTRKFWKLLIWNKKKSPEQILVKWMDILARTLVICQSFYCQQLPRYHKMFSVISVFWKGKIDVIGSICI